MQYNEYVMTRLRTADGLRTGDLAVRFGARKLQYFLRQAQKFTAAGTLQDVYKRQLQTICFPFVVLLE